MHINDLLLTKEELPFLGAINFKVPIHPRLLSSDIQLDPDLAKKVFPFVVDDWYSELQAYTASLEDVKKKQWIQEAFLKEGKPKVVKQYDEYALEGFSWRSTVITSENGFAHALGIERNYGGTLYLDRDNMETTFVSLKKNLGPIRFSREKALEFKCEEKIIDGTSVKVFIYSQHNVYHHPGALFLRNWGILYLNEAMKSIS